MPNGQKLLYGRYGTTTRQVLAKVNWSIQTRNEKYTSLRVICAWFTLLPKMFLNPVTKHHEDSSIYPTSHGSLPTLETLILIQTVKLI